MDLVSTTGTALDALRSGTAPLDAVLSSAISSATIAAVRSHAPRAGFRTLPTDETLVPDRRAEVTPAQFVERRLAVLLKGSAMPVSHIRLASRLSRNP